MQYYHASHEVYRQAMRFKQEERRFYFVVLLCMFLLCLVVTSALLYRPPGLNIAEHKEACLNPDSGSEYVLNSSQYEILRNIHSWGVGDTQVLNKVNICSYYLIRVSDNYDMLIFVDGVNSEKISMGQKINLRGDLVKAPSDFAESTGATLCFNVKNDAPGRLPGIILFSTLGLIILIAMIDMNHPRRRSYVSP